MKALQVACVVCFLQFVGAYMRIPIVPLFARGEGATAAEVGLIVGLFMLLSDSSLLPREAMRVRLPQTARPGRYCVVPAFGAPRRAPVLQCNVDAGGIWPVAHRK